MKVKPLGRRIVVELIKEAEKVIGSIIIPDSANETPLEGKIVGVGGDIKEKNIKMGNMVLLPKGGGTELTVDGKNLQIISIDDIVAVIK